jgi:hypothetical protein
MKKFFFLFFSLIISLGLFAQKDTLPNFSAIKKDGIISISWINGFKNVTQINIQRSKDSLKNFSTIHSLLNPNVKTYSYVDKTAKNDSGFYRIFILFEGSHYVFTTSRHLLIDTIKASVLHPGLIQNEKVKQKDEKENEYRLKEEKTSPPPKPVWVPSLTIFTGDDGNAIIKLPDATLKKYSVKFLKEDGSLLFLIPQIKETYLILDKVNFLKSGWYFFELTEDGKLKERNKFLITRDY